MSEDKKTCFIIMPITTPDSFIEIYRDGKDHFKHVLDCLHMPAVEAAGFDPIPPTAKGSDLIHAEIIHKLETSDLVLCDISTLNPNVFFELGVRTSLNKPVCLVKDEYTGKPPFDTGPVHHKDYQSSLDPWNLTTEIKEIASHIKESYEGSKSENTLWRQFGINSEAKPYERKAGVEGLFDELMFRLDSIQQQMDFMEMKSNEGSRDKGKLFKIIHSLRSMLPDDVKIENIDMTKGIMCIYYSGNIPDRQMMIIEDFMLSRHKMPVLLKNIKDSEQVIAPKIILRNFEAYKAPKETTDDEK